MASTDALPVPRKNAAYRVSFDLRLNTGALNSGAAGLDSEVSINGGTMADCTNEATEIATSSGHYYLDLTSTEMNGDCIVVQIKSSTTNAVTRTVVLYPQESGDIRVDVDSIKQSSTAATAQGAVATTMVTATVDTATFTATATDFETSLTASEATDFRKGRSVIFTSGALANQAARITGSTYTGNSKVRLTVTTLTAAPANGVSFYIV